MKTYQNRKQQFGAIAGAGLILVSLFAVSFQSLTFAQESTQTTNDPRQEDSGQVNVSDDGWSERNKADL